MAYDHNIIKYVQTRAFVRARSSWKGLKLFPTLITGTVGFLFWCIPVPHGVTSQSWHLLAIFLATIVGIITKPLPMAAMSLLSLTFCILTQTLTFEQSFSSFSSPVVWLIVFAFFIARGFIKTGLGTRLAYFFVFLLGRSSLGLSYGLVLTELLLAPFIPSNTARGAGIIFPIVNSLALEQGSSPFHQSQRKIGAFLILVSFHCNAITSAMFMTALVGNSMMASFMNSIGIHVNWMTWAIATCVPGCINLIVLPWVIYKIYPPEQKYSVEACQAAYLKLKEFGFLKIEECLMLFTFSIVFCLWIWGENFGITPATTGLLGVTLLLSTGVLSWSDIIKEKGAWETLIWFSILLMMATFLGKLGLIEWFSAQMQIHIGHYHWVESLAILGFVYFYSHYFFASITAHVTALYTAFLTVLLAIGTPPMIAAMSLAIFSNLSGTLTHYGSGTAPVFFSAGYVPIKDWWRLSFIFSLVNLSVWILISTLWWKILGYW